MLNKDKALRKLPTLTWEELDWLEKQCRFFKTDAVGARTFRSDGDDTSTQQAATALTDYFEDTFQKHHPGAYEP